MGQEKLCHDNAINTVYNRFPIQSENRSGKWCLSRMQHSQRGVKKVTKGTTVMSQGHDLSLGVIFLARRAEVFLRHDFSFQYHHSSFQEGGHPQEQ